MKPQHDRILRYMNEHGSITPMEAFSELGITKLSTRVGEMIADGIAIEKEREHGTNRYGDKVSYMRYRKGEEKC